MGSGIEAALRQRITVIYRSIERQYFRSLGLITGPMLLSASTRQSERLELSAIPLPNAEETPACI